MMKTINPTTGETIKEYQAMSQDQVTQILSDMDQAQEQWRKRSFAERAKHLRRAAELLREKKSEYGRLMAEEMGKPLSQGEAESEKCAWVCDYYAENAEDFLANEPIETNADHSYVAFNPLGIVLAIMPWNYPFWQLFRFAAPALMAGNAAVLKHAPNVSGCALAIEKLLHEAGVPKNLFRSLIVDVEEVQDIIENPLVKAVTLTGSTRAGKAVAAEAGAVLKKTVLELGGSDPYIVLADADVQQTAETLVTSRLLNSGQSCIAAKRFIVVEDVYDEFVDAVVELMKQKTTGDPLDPATDIGPQAREDLREQLHRQVRDSVEKGAKCLTGGQIPKGDGFFYPPTVLTNIRKGMPAYEEELFGPVASIFKVSDEEEAIRLANDTDYGLGAAIFSSDVERAERIAASELQAGCCFVNDFVKSDPRVPFGGIKQSGYGRELSAYGIREFVNTKTVSVG